MAFKWLRNQNDMYPDLVHCKNIVTRHFSKIKEFVYKNFGILKKFWYKRVSHKILVQKMPFINPFYYLYSQAPQIQGDPNQNLLFQMALPLKQCISDPMFVKSKLV